MDPRARLVLVVLAAGVGSRFGGEKQLAAVGPFGEALLDYTLFDAARAGFSRAVLVVRPGTEESWSVRVRARAARGVEVTIASQPIGLSPGGELPAGRRKPWGTGHALLAAESVVSTPFAVVNADDFYGAEAFEVAASFLASVDGARLQTAAAPPAWALVAYRLGHTLSPAGSVSRALCTVDSEDWVRALHETSVGPGEEETSRDATVSRTGDALVSMNFWCFGPQVFALLRRALETFAARADLDRDELRLPDVVEQLLARGEARVRALRHRGRWLGLTYAQDVEVVRRALRELVAEGRYPAPCG